MVGFSKFPKRTYIFYNYERGKFKPMQNSDDVKSESFKLSKTYLNRVRPLRFHPVQQQLMDDTYSINYRFNVVPAGRRCLEGNTLVCTPSGPVPIERLKVGDSVIGYNEFNLPEVTEVLEVHNNGLQEVFPLYNDVDYYFSATENHKLWGLNYYPGIYKRIEVKDLKRKVKIKRVHCYDLITGGKRNFKNAYLLGYLLGDNCPLEIKKNSKNVMYFSEWVSGRFSHEKICNWNIINRWNKESCLKFLAGIIDVDGLFEHKKYYGKLVLSIFTDSKVIVDVCSKIIFKYFQESPLLEFKKKKNILRINNNYLSGKVYRAVKPYLLKNNKMETSKFPVFICHYEACRFHRKEKYLAATFDITVGNSTNLYVLHKGGVITSNSGKTELMGKRRFVARVVQGVPVHNPRYFIGAPTREQAHRLYWQDLKVLTIPFRDWRKPPSESKLIIFLKGNREIHLLGMDKPERIEGSPWDGGVLDEYGNMKKKTWPEHVRPALSTPGRPPAWCDFIGVPEGRNHYYKLHQFALAQMTEKGSESDWNVAHWKSADILSAAEIAAAKEELDELTFDQEYCGSFVNFKGKAYYNFNEKDHYAKLNYNPDANLIFCFDFNVDPGVAAVIQEQNFIDNFSQMPVIGHIVTGIIGEVYIPQNSNTILVCNKLIADWGKHRGNVFIYGDSTGGSRGSAKVMGSDWDLVKQCLLPVFGNRLFFRVASTNPSERSRINAVNSRLKTMDGTVHLQVDPKKAPHVVYDLEGVVLVEGGSGEIDKKKTPELTHMCFASGTKVETDNGFVDISELPVQGRIKTVNGYIKYFDTGSKGIKETVKLLLNNGAEIVCTKDHLFLTLDGWIEAEHLKNHTLCNKWVKTHIPFRKRDMNRQEFSVYVEKNSERIELLYSNEKNDVLDVINVVENGLQEVYCPTVECGHFLLFDQISVSNSDAFGYYIEAVFPVRGRITETKKISGF